VLCELVHVSAGGEWSRFRRFKSEPVSHLRMLQREPRLAGTQYEL